ncbi:Transposable element Hobo transposase [Anabarilius grahami]|uniref:Transposable element Hobo transposase n=1 Tax=Anabarilius grahami TaxID=495550 RepID=A0A3N0Y109_ANAGA|nr:Transposable element Hobo transposase [Anabarilius grahami]
MTDTIAKYGCAVTTDIWTENYQKTSFLSATIHYIEANYDLVSRVLFATPFDAGTSKTGDNIRAFLFQNLRVFGIDSSQAKKLVFVTDRGANMVAALRGFTRLNCSAHILNTILSHAFSSAVMDKTPEVGNLLKDVKKLVTYFKHSGLQVKLSKSLKQSVETRWNSNFEMLDSVFQQYDEIATILLDNKQYDKVGCIDKNILKTLVTFLKPFKDATNDLESDNTALSASLVLPWSVKLRIHCEAARTDCILSEIASTCLQRLDELIVTVHYPLSHTVVCVKVLGIVVWSPGVCPVVLVLYVPGLAFSSLFLVSVCYIGFSFWITFTDHHTDTRTHLTDHHSLRTFTAHRSP